MKKIFYTAIIALLISCNKESKWKQYIIENADNIHKNEHGTFNIDSLKGYYTDLSIRLNADSYYSVVVWGDRESFLWDFRKDYYFSIDLNHRKYKGLDTDKDIELINVIKNK